MHSICTQCQKPFEISPEEQKFLEKVSPKIGGQVFPIPVPKSCPDCRLAGRTLYRNEQYLYHNRSTVSGKPLISLYSPDTNWGKNFKIFTHEEWWSDNWDALNYGRDFDFNHPFFDQLHELNLQIPKVNLIQVNNDNCPYTTGTGYCKNCYLINCSENCENCYYGKLLQGCRNCMDCSYTYESELCYECFSITKCYDCKYLFYSQNCYNCWFSENLRSCKNCFLCTNLVNKEYHFMNEPLSKEEYEKRVKNILNNPENLKKARELLEDIRKKRIHKYANVLNSENSTGDFLTNCKNCMDCYDMNDSEDCRYVTVGVNVKDLMDCSNMYLKPELNYQVLGTIQTYNVIFSLYIFHSQDVAYSQFCYFSQNLFGCIGLRNKKYCILNKQYKKEQYENLVPKIIEHMKKTTSQWGEYFPAQHAPFGYNETVAQEYLPLTEEESKQKGYQWKEKDKKEYQKQSYSVPDKISEVPDTIINEILACEQCGKNYKIIPQELKTLRNIFLPIPRLCPDCRHQNRMNLRNPRKLWLRKCNQCQTEIQTTYNPNQSEVIYCEPCYLKNIY